MADGDRQLPLVALIGRPNVGKSTLFNRLVGERSAVVEPQPGTTRDRIYGELEWRGRAFAVVDTAGIAWHDPAPVAEAAVSCAPATGTPSAYRARASSPTRPARPSAVP